MMKEIYLDNSATTRAYDSVGDLVRKVMCEDYGNPSSMRGGREVYKRSKGDICEAFEGSGEGSVLYFWRNRE